MSEITSSVAISLLVTFLIDFIIQLIFYIVSAVLATEKFYDFSGAITYISCILTALLYRHLDDKLSDLSARQIIAAAFVLIWALRLGIFLFLRVLRIQDKFSIPWILQVIWIFITALPVYVILGNAGTESRKDIFWSDIVGIIIWAFGFYVEAVADYQKFTFKNEHPNDFIQSGLWKYSRYANYNGEITLWIGMFILCTGGFIQDWQWVTIISPIFVTLLITRLSGIPILEASSDKRYGKRPDYIAYKSRTSKFFLWPPKDTERNA